MTVEAIQEELALLDGQERRRILEYLRGLEDANGDKLRLHESVADYRAGRTVSADTVHRELRERLAHE